MNIFYLISKMSCNKSGSRRVPIQHYLMKKLESKEKSMNILYLISKMSCNKSGSRRVPIQHYLMKNIGTERKINEYLLFDQQNVLQQIWQRESTNTGLFDEKKLESKEKSMNIVYLISKMSCNKSGSRRVPIQQYFGNCWNRKKNQ